MKSPLFLLVFSIAIDAACFAGPRGMSSRVSHNNGGLITSAPSEPEAAPAPAYTRDGSWMAITNKIGQLAFYRVKNAKERDLLNLKVIRAEMAGNTNFVDSARLDLLDTYLTAQNKAIAKLSMDQKAIEAAYSKAGKS
jgi:hypothetical protein